MSMQVLDEMIRELHELEPDAFGARVAQRAAPMLEKAVKATAAAGRAPDGTPWAPCKDGGRAMVHAADHVEASAHGAIVRVTLTGPDVFHHLGLRGEPRRQVIPDRGGSELPDVVVDVLTRAAREELEATTQGGR